MKILLTILIVIFSFNVLSQKYNRTLATKLGADEYGMKPYVLAILKSGKYVAKSDHESDSLFAGHMKNIGKLVEQKKLIVAGPLGKNDKTYRGIFIFDVSTIDEARQLTETDPAVNAGIFEVEYYNWYGGAALSQYLKTQKRITKTKIIKK